MQAEAQLVFSYGIWGLGINDRLKKGVYFSWALLRNEFAFSVEGVYVALFVMNEQAWVIYRVLARLLYYSFGRISAGFGEYVMRILIGECYSQRIVCSLKRILMLRLFWPT